LQSNPKRGWETTPPDSREKVAIRSLTDYKQQEMFKITDPATRDLVKGCIPALLVSAAVTVVLAIGVWWWLSK
jgi:hypothetical protein